MNDATEHPVVHRAEVEIYLRHTDAAGVLFYPRLLEMAHEVTEQLLVQIGYPIADMVAGRLHHLPIVHAEADYLLPMRLGERYEVTIALHKLGERSLGFTCTFLREGRAAAVTRVDHAAIDPATRQVCGLDEDFRRALERLGS